MDWFCWISASLPLSLTRSLPHSRLSLPDLVCCWMHGFYIFLFTSLPHSLALSRNRSLTPANSFPLSFVLSNALARSLTRSFAHSLTHQLTRSLALNSVTRSSLPTHSLAPYFL